MRALRATWRKTNTYVVLGPFVIALAFPFYWMLTTMFKRDLDLYNQKSIPYTFNDNQGHAHWDFWNYMTFHHVSFLFKHTEYPTWLLNTAIVGIAVVTTVPSKAETTSASITAPVVARRSREGMISTWSRASYAASA